MSLVFSIKFGGGGDSPATLNESMRPHLCINSDELRLSLCNSHANPHNSLATGYFLFQKIFGVM